MFAVCMKHGHWSEVAIHTHTLSQQDPHKAWLLLWDWNIKLITSASKTLTKHGDWSEIVTHIHKHTKSASKTRTKHFRWSEITT